MIKIIPAIIPKSLEHLEETLNQIGLFTHEVQIDIVDGTFVPFVSWPYADDASFSDLAAIIKDFDVEIDLMVREPEKALESYLGVGVKRVVVHLESTHHLKRIVALKEAYDFELGLSILNDTGISVLESVIEHATYVQCMGIANIGTQGQSFDERVLERVSYLKKAYPNLLISIDGSVNTETIRRLYDAGAERFVSGSAILAHENPKAAYEELKALCEK